MHNVSGWLPSLLLLTLPFYTLTESDVYESVSCGTLLGDHRYCLDYSNADLTEPPVGWNITTILDLSANRIELIDGTRFQDQMLLVELDLSNNQIKTIDVRALQNLKNLKELKLGNNDFVCDNSICPLHSWLKANEHKVADIDLVICSSPAENEGRRVIDVDTSFLCRNVSLNHGFEINTGTVFMIWIVVPILITCLTALYIVVNGNNRFGRTIRASLWSCCRGVFPTGRPSSLAVWAATSDEREQPTAQSPNLTPDFELETTPMSSSAAPSMGEDAQYLAPVESVQGEGDEGGREGREGRRVEIHDVVPGPSSNGTITISSS